MDNILKLHRMKNLIKSNQLLNALNGKPSMDYNKWERQVLDTLTDVMGITNSDAQGIIECYPAEMLQSYNEGLTPEETAFKIDNQEWSI